MSNLRIGTSGWNYPSGKGTWNGVFYPKRRPKGFDELAYYAEHFDTVEVNSTFYGQPRVDVSRRWAERTPRGFEFAVKLYQKFTHPRMFGERVAKQIGTKAPGDLRPDEDAVKALASVNQADLDEFRRGIEPIAAAGKLGALLAQFPPSFKDTPESREILAGLLRAFHDYPIAVELRHSTWSDRVGDTLSLLNTFKAAWVQIDEPKFRLSIRQNYLPNVKGFYYMRLHGRNAAKWWKHDTSDDRYDYLYSAEELKEFSETAAATRALVKKSYLYTNNHFSAKSVANAAMLKAQLGEPGKPIGGEYPPEFLERYPELRGVVNHEAREGTKLFSERTS
ncbi:MAG TPA: DUF72 domain-containing protein [Vicinamibacterales bacterium]|nr:DUF72 domain-containing protein [Vicinamibacterales bacterium]